MPSFKIKYGFFLLLVLGYSSLLAQTYTPIGFPNELPSEYRFNAIKDYYKIADRKAPKGIKKRDYKRFAEMASFNKSYKFRDGGVYVQWKELEDYLNQVLQTILPLAQKGKKNVHIYVSRDPSYNAFAIHDGSLFFNVGYMADITNEAALAIILGHEYAHYTFHDAENSFRHSLKLSGKFVRNQNYELRIDKAHEDRKQEQKADSIGFLLAQTAGYDIHYGFDNFQQFIELRSLLYERAPAGTLRESLLDSLKKLADHPEDELRIKALERIIAKNLPKTAVTDYIVNQPLFESFQHQAKIETLSLLLANGQLQSCVERAFRFYLLEPDNNDYTYYLLEGLRRMFFIKPGLKNKGFLALGFEHKLGKGEGILHRPYLLLRNASLLKNTKAPELSDSLHVAFETNGQAFDYFLKLAKRKGIIESYLTKALYLYQQKDSTYKDWLLQYTAFENPRHADLAEALLSNNLKQEKGTKEVVIINDITFKEDHIYGYYNRLLLGQEHSPKYIDALKKMMQTQFPKKHLIEINALAKQDFNLAYRYRHALATAVGLFAALHDTATTDITADSIRTQDSLKLAQENESPRKKKKKQQAHLGNTNVEQVQLFVYEPDFWTLFKDNELKTIEFLNVMAFDDKTQLWGLTKILNPLYLAFGFLSDLDLKYVVGSYRYGYKVDYYSYRPSSKEKEVFIYSDITHYKMYKAYLANEVYYAFKLREKTKSK